MPTLKVIHIAKSLQANRTSQNLSISMLLPMQTEENSQWVTMYIKNKLDSIKIKGCSPLPKVFGTATYSCTNVSVYCKAAYIISYEMWDLSEIFVPK